jgi:thiamine-phosphate pyrophosphorylase
MAPNFYKFILITDLRNNSLDEYLKFIKKCATSGITSVQLRDKYRDEEFLFKFGKSLKKVLDPLNIPLIVNDNVELALKLNADGVHLGKSDGDWQLARQKIGKSKFIGVSIETKEDLYRTNQLELDYIAASAVFESFNKQDIIKIWGLKGVEELAQLSIHPVLGVGGINLDNLESIMKAKAKGVAVIGAIHQAENPVEIVQNMRKIIDNYS